MSTPKKPERTKIGVSQPQDSKKTVVNPSTLKYRPATPAEVLLYKDLLRSYSYAEWQ